ncbi:LysR family transcriptional regulator, partial [Pseudomonas sp. MWU12-2534b]
MLGQLHDVDLQLLRLFVRVAECGGFSAAQGVLRLSQSSICQQMAKLESRFGYRLCCPGKGPFIMTPQGGQLLISIRTLSESIEPFRYHSNGLSCLSIF